MTKLLPMILISCLVLTPASMAGNTLVDKDSRHLLTTRHMDIHYGSEKDLARLDGSLCSSRSLGGLFSSLFSRGEEKERKNLADRADKLCQRVRGLLGISVPGPRVAMEVVADKDAFTKALAERGADDLAAQGPAVYLPGPRILLVDASRTGEADLAEGMARALAQTALPRTPPQAAVDILAQYVHKAVYSS